MRYSKHLLIVICSLVVSNLLFAQQGWHQVQSGTTVKLNGMLNSVDYLTKIWVVGENGTMLLSTNLGSSFIQQTVPTTSELFDMELIEAFNGGLCAVGTSGTILRTSDFGETWHLANTNVSVTLRAIMNEYVVGDSGTVLRTSDGGVNWTRQNQNLTTRKLNDLYDDFSSTLIAVGDNGTILKWHIPTNNWSLLTSGVTANLKSVHRLTKIVNGATRFLYIACGENGVILTTTDWGVTWVQENPNTNVTLTSIFETREALPFEIIWTCGTQGKIFSSINDGITWIAANSPVSSNLNAISFGTPHHGVPSETGFIAGDGGIILRAFNQGITSSNNHSGTLPSNFKLYQNYPNPFNPMTNIRFQMPKVGFVELKIFDALGREIETIVSEQLNPGTYEINWYASSVPSGIYYYKLIAEDYSETKKMMLIK